MTQENEITVRDNLSIEYIAGLFDGEGNVNISTVGPTNHKSIRIAITGSYRPMIESIYQTLKIGSFSTQKRQVLHKTVKHFYTTDPNLVNHDKNIKLCKQCWRWLVTSRIDAKDFLTKIYPYLIEKREQVRVCLEFLDGKLDGDEALRLCKEYKKFNFPANNFETVRFNMRTKRGEDSLASKLSNEQVTDIYLKYHRDKLTVKNIWKLYPNMSIQSVDGVIHGRSWKHITQNIVV